MLDRVSDLRLSPEATVLLLRAMMAGMSYAFEDVLSMEYLNVELALGGGCYTGRYNDAVFRFVYEPDGGVEITVSGGEPNLRYALWVALNMLSGISVIG